jgi:HK97 family phage major capsid protein
MDLTPEIKGALEAHGTALQAAIDKFDGQLKDAGSVAGEAKAEVKALSEKFEQTITEIAQKMDTAKSEPAIITAGAEFIASPLFKQFAAGQIDKVRMELKTAVLSNGTTVFPDQRPGIIPGSFGPLTVRQAIPSINVSTNAVNSLKENSWANSAQEVSQATVKTESDITFTNYDVGIRTIAHYVVVTKQLLDDAPAVASYIDLRLRDGLAQRVDKQLIAGNGTSPNLSGLTDSGNYTAFTAATTTDNLIDSINNCKYTMWALGNVPDTVIINPADWGVVERMRESAGSGMYLFGTPGSNASQNPFGIYTRQGSTVEAGYTGDDFIYNRVTLRAEERLALACDRPAGIYYGQH